MHHHRLILNGPPPDVAALARALRDAGAATVADGPPPTLVWSTPREGALRALCRGHPDVVVGAERFAALGDAYERVVLQGAEATVLERRAFAAHEEDERHDPAAPPSPPGRAAVAAPPQRAALRRAALAVAAEPTVLGTTTGTALDDALLVAAAAGRLATHAGDPLALDRPPRAARAALRALAAAGLTAGATAAGPGCAAELAFERAWRLAQAHACAAGDPFAIEPGDADWPDWLMFALSCAAGLVEACAAWTARPPAGAGAAVHREHFATADEHLEHAAALLTITTLQALALFDA